MEKFDITRYKYHYLLAFVAITFILLVWHAFSYIVPNTDVEPEATQEMSVDIDTEGNYAEDDADDSESDVEDDEADDDDSDAADDDEEEDAEVEEYINSMVDSDEYIRSTKSRRVGQY